MRPASPPRADGMTLLELLVAISILAIITTLAYRGIDTLIRSNDRLLQESTRWQAISLFFTRFGNDVSQPSPRPIRTSGAAASQGGASNGTDVILPAWQGLAIPALPPDDTGYAAQLEFTRKSESGRDEIRLGYRLRGTRLELLVWPAPDRAPNTRPEIYTLLEGIASLHFRYLDDSLIWQESWPPVGTLNDRRPRSVEIEIESGTENASGARPKDGIRLRRVFALPS